ncbi:hypothetical protein [Lentzea sp. NPDC051838]|uniref:hypothetical protein n=1 Tax=Lentzea sp. NPDC051838 TaxID=3154849 RepID=UPI003416B07F
MATDNTTLMCGRCLREFGGLNKPPAGLTREFFLTDEMRAAFNSHHIGRIFRAYRQHERFLKLLGRPLSQEEFGRWLGLSQTAVSRIEGVKPEQNLKALLEYATALHLPKDLLWFDFPGENRADVTLIENRNGARSGFGNAVSKPQPDWLEPAYEFAVADHRATSDVQFVRLAAQESVNYGLRHPVTELHYSTLDQIEDEVRKLAFDFISKDPLETFNRSRQLRNDIFILLESKRLPSQEQQLYAYGARTLGYLAGASSDFYGLYEAAADQLRLARQFADASEFAELRSWVLSLQSANTFWMKDWLKAATFAERALAVAVTKSGFMRATSMRVRALARLGDKEGLHAAIERAEANPIEGAKEEERGMILFSEPNHLRCIGTAYLWAGEYSRAREKLTQALSRYLTESPEHFANIAVIRADIAASALHENDVVSAAQSIAPLFEIAPTYRVEGAIRRLRDMQKQLQNEVFARSQPAVDLQQKISTFLGDTAPKPEPEGD